MRLITWCRLRRAERNAFRWEAWRGSTHLFPPQYMPRCHDVYGGIGRTVSEWEAWKRERDKGRDGESDKLV